MATAQETIVAALQALRVLGEGQQPTTARNQYALRQLNSYIRQLAGFSGSLTFVNYRPDGNYELTTRWPAVRLQCMGGYTITLPKGDGGVPVPDGMRVDIVDVAGTAAASNITIARNGWKINGSAADYTINTNGASVGLMFRADLGDWKLVDDLALADALPFSEDFDEAIALNLARRLTLYGQSLSRDDEKRADMGAKRIRARYAKPPAAAFDAAISSIGGSYNRRATTGSLNDFLNGND
jgi:hypothetical protein